MSLIFIFSLFLSVSGFCSATFYHHHHFHHNWRTFHHRPRIIFSQVRRFRQPPSFITNNLRVPYIRPNAGMIPNNFLPPNLFPVATVYPSRGHNFPNPLNNLNTYDLPPWTQVPPVVNNGPVFPNGQTIIPHLPSGEVQVTVPGREPVPTVSETANGNDDDDDDQQTQTVTIPPPKVTLPPTTVQPEQKKTCQEYGCEIGSECVFQNSWICPADKTDIPCQCQRGCRMQFTFIPLGASTIVDTCGNICSCNSLFGGVNCTEIPCGQPTTEEETPGLVLEPVPTDMPDKGPLRGDFPVVGIPTGQQTSETTDLTFPEQNFVPPIPFLTENTFPGFNPIQDGQSENSNTIDPLVKSTELNNDSLNGKVVFPFAPVKSIEIPKDNVVFPFAPVS